MIVGTLAKHVPEHQMTIETRRHQALAIGRKFTTGNLAIVALKNKLLEMSLSLALLVQLQEMNFN